MTFRSELTMSALLHRHATLPGLGLLALLGAAALFAAGLPGMASHGLSALSLAIIGGAVLGNLRPALGQGACVPGLRFAQRVLLRAGVALYGFNLDFEQIARVGSRGIGVDLVMVASTLTLGWFVGSRLLGLDRDTVLLTSAGSAICGAAAVVATVPVLQCKDESVIDKTAAAVATVLLFGTLAMFCYPLLFAWLDLPRGAFGVYIGSTVHEVAQVVAIGNLLGDDVARNAVIVKMIRVMLLVPFLLGLSALLRGEGTRRRSVTIPWFALIFVAFSGVNSLQILPHALIAGLREACVVCLVAAMAALGLDTTFARLRQTGPRVFVLGLCLFAWLVVGGGVVNAISAAG
jgi:uncharacterized integral membrane protein (TIGR00698 family)